MGKTGRSDPGLFGGYTNYDSKGHKAGRSDPGIFGGYSNYDSSGHKVSRSEPNLFGGYTHYDSSGHKVGRSEPGIFGGYTHYDAKGHKTGSSSPNMTGGYTHHDGDDACYIATAVYGSYDCPPVWTLRRFRDRSLKATSMGRLFIRVYYKTSPYLIRWFGRFAPVRNWCRHRLDRFVLLLQARGYEDIPYVDNKK